MFVTKVKLTFGWFILLSLTYLMPIPEIFYLTGLACSVTFMFLLLTGMNSYFFAGIGFFHSMYTKCRFEFKRHRNRQITLFIVTCSSFGFFFLCTFFSLYFNACLFMNHVVNPDLEELDNKGFCNFMSFNSLSGHL